MSTNGRFSAVHRGYVSRIFAALGFAFGDFDSVCVRFDIEFLPESELKHLAELAQIRAIPFCILIRTLFGDKMPEIMTTAINRAADSAQDAE